MNVVNRPRISTFVATIYFVLVVFIAACAGFFTYATFFTPMGSFGLPAIVVSLIVEAIMLLILASIYRTEYVLKDEELIIRTTRLIGGSKRIRLKDVLHAERTLIPFGMRLFGASFHGGYYHVPGLGRAFMTVTNFNDGVLVKTKHENFIITPRKPEEFVQALKSLTIALSQNDTK